MRYYYVTRAPARGKHHLVRPFDLRDRLYVSALCPTSVRRGDVLTADVPRVPGGRRTVAVWRRVFGEELCDHCGRIAEHEEKRRERDRTIRERTLREEFHAAGDMPPEDRI